MAIAGGRISAMRALSCGWPRRSRRYHAPAPREVVGLALPQEPDRLLPLAASKSHQAPEHEGVAVPGKPGGPTHRVVLLDREFRVIHAAFPECLDEVVDMQHEH